MIRGGVSGARIPHVFDIQKKNIPLPLLSAPDKSIISICYIFVSLYLKRSDEVAPPAPPAGEVCHVQ